MERWSQPYLPLFQVQVFFRCSFRNQMCNWFCRSPFHPHGVLFHRLSSHQPVCAPLWNWTGIPMLSKWRPIVLDTSIIFAHFHQTSKRMHTDGFFLSPPLQPLPESMVARLCESKKVCGAADTQLQVKRPSFTKMLEEFSNPFNTLVSVMTHSSDHNYLSRPLICP